MKLPFGKTEAEHNAFCDSMKCHNGNYCNFMLGKCPQCQEEYKQRYGEEWKDPSLSQKNMEVI